jgi:prepilin-type N-terminal cleavage/methylation domain-containing protein
MTMKMNRKILNNGTQESGAGITRNHLLRQTCVQPAFTLIELLVVISIIAILAAFSVPVLKGLKRTQVLKQTRAEMAQLETAIDSYKAAYGFYPPSNAAYPATPSAAWFSPLYFELLGTTNNNGTYQTLDGSASIPVAAVTSPGPLGVGGFINCAKSGAGEDAPAAKSFLQGLKSKQIGLNITNQTYPAYPVALILGAVGGPDQNYQPFGAPDLNPWRYVYPGVNNPNSYDLWIQLVIGGKTNLVCNWSDQVQINNPLP